MASARRRPRLVAACCAAGACWLSANALGMLLFAPSGGLEVGGASEEAVQRAPTPTRRSSALGLVAATAGAASALREQPARAEESAVPSAPAPLVLDESGLLTPSTEKSLDRRLRKLEADTGLKLRVICPPAGLQTQREAWRSYLRPISKRMGIDESSLVIVAEETAQARSGRMLGLLTINPGYKLQERYQYRLTNDFLFRVSTFYGFPKYVDEKGTDTAITEATNELVAVLYKLTEDKSMRFISPLTAKEVEEVLDKHSA